MFVLPHVASALLGALAARAQLTAPSFTDVAYYPGASCAALACPHPGSEQCLDVYLPAARPSGRPTLIFVHGGAWTGGDKSSPGNVDFCERLRELGHAVVSCNYTLACRDQPAYPQAIRDVRAVLAWIRGPGGRPPYSLDPCVVAIGSSAGAHLAALLGVLADEDQPLFLPVGAYPVRDLAPQLVIALSGPFDFYRFGRSGADAPPAWCPCSAVGFAPGYPPTVLGTGTQTFLGCDWDASCNILPCLPEMVRWDDPCLAPNELTGNPFVDASPIHWVSPADPPFAFLFSPCDAIVPGVESHWMSAALESVGVAGNLHEIDACGHAFLLFPGPRDAADEVDRVLSAELAGCR